MKAIAAMARNRVIGDKGSIPWHLPEDFKWFKQTTLGGVVVMGRKTFESLGRPLPGRRNVVISSSAQFEGVDNVRDASALDEKDYSPATVWVIGGALVYEKMLPLCSDLYLSIVNMAPTGDVFFPEFESQFRLESIVARFDEFEIHHFRNLKF